MGSLIALNLTTVMPDHFKAVSLYAPFFGRMKEQDKFDRLLPLAKLVNLVNPEFKIKGYPKIPNWL